MATPLKYMYNPAYFEALCPVLARCIPNFDCKKFIMLIFNNEWPDKELKERVRHISNTLHYFLSDDFPIAAKQVVRISNELLLTTREQNFASIFLPDYIEVFGLDHPQASLEALGEVTKLVSAEFAVRPFILRYPDIAFRWLHRWSRSEHSSVRRLSSEGCRPRLPWAQALHSLKKDPAPILPILERLKEDPSEYVRRSVANNLNDIGKDHPELILRLAREWAGKHPHTDWIVRHGCRSLLKKGDVKALSLFGFKAESKARVKDLLHSKKVVIGDSLDFRFSFVNTDKVPAPFRLEYAIDYITSTGKTSRKVFKLKEGVFSPGEAVDIRRKQSFRDFTTRKHYRGKHRLTILANGRKLAASEFLVQ